MYVKEDGNKGFSEKQTIPPFVLAFERKLEVTEVGGGGCVEVSAIILIILVSSIY